MPRFAWTLVVVGCGTSPSPSDEAGRTPPAPEVVPRSPTDAAALAPAGLRHVELLRIDQDFHPNDDYEIALDAWVPIDGPPSIAEVRMWWVDTAQHDRRSVFGKGVRRHIDIGYQTIDATHWRVSIARDDTVFSFEIVVEGTEPRAYGIVDTTEGGRIDRCRPTTARLMANKVFGIPTGLDRLEVHCVAPEGTEHDGRLVEG